MKKSLFILASAALVLASCNNDVQIAENVGLADGNQQKEIAFSMYSQRPNRVKGNAPVIGETFPTTNTMEVKAYQSAPTAAEYFDKCTFTQEGTYWRGGKYWPLSPATINFFAVSGADLTESHITIADAFANAQVAYTAANSYSQTTQSDIMYAFGRGAVTQSGNVLSFPEKVDMQFKHALALVGFEVKGDGSAETTNIKVNSITLNGATYNGTLTLTPSATATAAEGDVTTTVSWAAGSTVNDVVVPNITANTGINSSYQPIGDGLMIIPGTGFTNFVINYTFDSKTYNYTYTPVPAFTTAEAGKKYLYRINFKLHQIEINPTVANWDNGDTTYVQIAPVTTKHGATPLHIRANDPGYYTVYVTDLGASEAYTVATNDEDDILATAPATSGTADANGVATITFKAKATTGLHSAIITLTKTSDSSTTLIYVDQTVVAP